MKKKILIDTIAAYHGSKGIFRTWVKNEPHIVALEEFVTNLQLDPEQQLSPKDLVALIDILLSYQSLTQSASSNTFIQLANFFGGYLELNRLKQNNLLTEKYVYLLEKSAGKAEQLCWLITEVNKIDGCAAMVSELSQICVDKLTRQEDESHSIRMLNYQLKALRYAGRLTKLTEKMYGFIKETSAYILKAQTKLMSYIYINISRAIPDECVSFLLQYIKDSKLLDMLNLLDLKGKSFDEVIIYVLNSENFKNVENLLGNFSTQPEFFLKSLKQMMEATPKQEIPVESPEIKSSALATELRAKSTIVKIKVTEALKTLGLYPEPVERSGSDIDPDDDRTFGI